jgi:hypothetical protein
MPARLSKTQKKQPPKQNAGMQSLFGSIFVSNVKALRFSVQSNKRALGHRRQQQQQQPQQPKAYDGFGVAVRSPNEQHQPRQL